MLDEKRKILFIVPVLTHGGAERVVSVLSNALNDKGHQVSIVVLYRSPAEYAVNKSVIIYELNATKPIIKFVQRPLRIRRYIKLFNPDYIVPFLPWAVVNSFFACIGLKNIFIGTVRNNPDFDNGVIGRAFKWALNKSDAIFCQTYSQQALLPDFLARKSFVLPNPVTTDIINCYSRRIYKTKIRRFISLGKLEPQKNHSLMIEAFVKAHEHHSDLALEIYGEGSCRDELLQLIKENGAEDYIFLKGRSESVEKVLLAADAFLFTSNYEVMPNALMEAMASGLPCISTDCPTGPKELLGDNQRGLLVPVKQIAPLVNSINQIVENVGLSVEFGRKAHDYIKGNFNPDVIAGRLIEYCIKYERKKNV